MVRIKLKLPFLPILFIFCSALNSNAQLRLQQSNQIQSAQYSSLPLTNTHCTEVVPQRAIMTSNMNQIEVFGTDLNAISTIATTSAETNADGIATCNYKNCSASNTLSHTKTNRKNDVVFQTPQHNRVKRVTDSNLALIRNQSSNAILPPPLFDESTTISTATLPLLPNDSVRQMKSRRHHRTIPRHFTMSDSANNTSASNPLIPKAKVYDDSTKSAANCSVVSGTATLNKKSVCQCPVQHVPMTYMGSAHLNLTRNQQPNEILLSTLTKKLPHHKSNVAKSASFTSNPTTLSSSTAVGYNRNSASGLLSATNPVTQASNVTHANSATGNSSATKTSSKITTISKQIGNHELSNIIHPQQPMNETNDAKSIHELLPINISQTSNSNLQKNASNASMADKIDTSIQSNPVLPPKMSKSNPIFHRQTEKIPKQMATGSNCSGLIASATQTPLNGFHHRSHSSRDRSKSPSVDKTYSMALPIIVGNDRIVPNHIKTTFPTTSNLTIASNFSSSKSLPIAQTQQPTVIVKSPIGIPNSMSNHRSAMCSSKIHSSSPKPKLATKESEMKKMSEGRRMSGSLLDDKQNRTEIEKSLPVYTTSENCSNPREHNLLKEGSTEDDYLSVCENCNFVDQSNGDQEMEPQGTMTLHRNMNEKEADDPSNSYYRTSTTLPTNTKQKTT